MWCVNGGKQGIVGLASSRSRGVKSPNRGTKPISDDDYGRVGMSGYDVYKGG